MKKYPQIKEEILKYYAGKDPNSIQNIKFNSKDWDDWCNFIASTKDSNHLKLHKDSTGQNMCYTAFAICKGIKSEQLITANHFYIQKSMVGDFVTFYGALDTNILYENGRLRHPQLIIISPTGPFSELFESAWDLLLKYYPNCSYVSYNWLNLFPKEPEFKNKNIHSLLFGYEGDLKTNIYGNPLYSPEDLGDLNRLVVG